MSFKKPDDDPWVSLARLFAPKDVAPGLVPGSPGSLLSALAKLQNPSPPSRPLDLKHLSSALARNGNPPVRPRLTIPVQRRNGVSIGECQSLVGELLKDKPTVSPGRVAPDIDDLAIGEGRKIRACFVYTDLHGFTKIVAAQQTVTSFNLLQVFVEIMSRITTHYGGKVVDCAGDRVLSVFHRHASDLSRQPIYDGITAALWMQTIVQRVISPAFNSKGVPEVSVSIGVDYGLNMNEPRNNICGEDLILPLPCPADADSFLDRQKGTAEARDIRLVAVRQSHICRIDPPLH